MAKITPEQRERLKNAVLYSQQDPGKVAELIADLIEAATEDTDENP